MKPSRVDVVLVLLVGVRFINPITEALSINMRGGMWMAYALLKELEGGRRKTSELRQSTPLYGTAFDWAVTGLLSMGLAKRVVEGGDEYLEITDAGRNWLGTWPWPWAQWGYGWGPRHGRCW